MRIYKGAVLFVDLLGSGALTKAKEDTVTKEDFAAFGRTNQTSLRNQVFFAILLTQFRKNLRWKAEPKVRVAQLSDCAFIWSEDHNRVVEFARSLFWKSLRSGLLCRGGMTHGEIVEPKKIGKSIGDFVCGEAVTRSVELERTGKGSRIFIDRHIGGLVYSNTPPNVFEPTSSAIDFKTIDEYLWFALPAKGNVLYDTPAEHIMDIIDASLRLRFAPHFRWNAVSDEGRLHVGATIERMSMFVNRFCKDKQLPIPDFPFVSADMFMEMGKFGEDTERNGQKYNAIIKLAKDYRRKHLSKN